MGLFWQLVYPPRMQEQMAVVQQDYESAMQTVCRLCPVSGYRSEALRLLEASLMRALWSFRLQKGGGK
jgi:hypothetical protein